MKLASLVACAGVIALASEAAAGGYVTAGVGGSPDLGGELDVHLDADGGRAGRVGVGHRFGPVSLEVGVGGFGVVGTAPSGAVVDGTALSAAASIKVHAPIVVGLGAFARAGLERTWIRGGDMATFSGEGYVIGAGLDYTIPLPLDATIWLELGREYMTLVQSMGGYAGTADMLLLGLSVGL